MQSPFKVFRKHQKVVLAGLTLMAMIGFGLGDVLTKMGRGGGSAQASKDVVETNIGNLSQMEMSHLVAQRSIVHRFILLAFMASHPEMSFMARDERFSRRIISQFGFGGESRPALLDAWLYRYEARKMGIVVSDEQIRNYIKSFTEFRFMSTSSTNRLSTERFSSILEQLRLSPKELFDMFREELQGDIARRMKVPAYLPSPEKFWDYYQQLNTRQKIEVAALPVQDFTEAVPEPAEKEIASLFEKHKVDFEQASGGVFRPGFRQPDKVKLHSLALGRNVVDDQVAASGPVTDKEIDDYYERHKDTDMRFYEFEAPPLDDTTPIDPQFAPEKGPSLDGDSKESSEAVREKSEGPSGTDGAAKPPAEGERQNDGNAPQDNADSGKKESDCSSVGAEESAAKDEKKPAAADGATKEKAAGESEADAGSPGKAGSDDAEFVPEPPALPEGGDDDKGGATAKSGGKKAPPKKKYKPLDDSLREQIRDSVINDRRKKFLQAEKDKAVEALRDLGLRFSTSPDIKLTDPKPEELKVLQQRSEDELRKIAGSLGMKFIETGLVSREELREIPGLGSAIEFGWNESPRMEMSTIVDQAFENESLCRAFVSEALDETIYISWKVQFSATHVPTLDEPGIREQVVKAWKRVEALPLAKKRAEELAERARQKKNDLEAGLKDQTVTGDARGLSLFVRESPEFSFYRESFAPDPLHNQGASVQIGNPIVVTKPGRKFMQTVFDDIPEGEIGTALNDDASVYYLVKVVSRRPAERVEFQQAIDKLFVPGSPYMEVAGLDVRETGEEYSRMMAEKYAIRWNDLPTRESYNPVFEDE